MSKTGQPADETPTPTPRTDALREIPRLFEYLDYVRPDAPRNAIEPYQHEGSYSFEDLRKIRDHAKQLERELSQAHSEIERLKHGHKTLLDAMADAADEKQSLGAEIARLKEDAEKMNKEMSRAIQPELYQEKCLEIEYLTNAKLATEKHSIEFQSELESTRAERDAVYQHTCLHHTDAQRADAHNQCPVCLMRELEAARARLAEVEKERDDWNKCAAEHLQDAVKLTTGFNAEIAELTASRDAALEQVEAMRRALEPILVQLQSYSMGHRECGQTHRYTGSVNATDVEKLNQLISSTHAPAKEGETKS